MVRKPSAGPGIPRGISSPVARLRQPSLLVAVDAYQVGSDIRRRPISPLRIKVQDGGRVIELS
jgi:hypothetical protein